VTAKGAIGFDNAPASLQRPSQALVWPFRTST
jgi:hypothetical protein